MKKSLIATLLLVFLMATPAPAMDEEGSGWLQDFGKAKKEATDKGKLIMAYFWFKG